MLTLLRAYAGIVTLALRLGRKLAWIALALMVVIILLQVFCRYVLGDALNWPDEAARFLMLWMAALIAPSAMRWSGFVAIDMVPSALPRRAGLLLMLSLLVLSLMVLAVAISHGYNHTFGFGGNFDSSSLRVPLNLIGLETVTVKLRYMYMSLFVCVCALAVVTVELILRSIYQIVSPETELPDDDFSIAMGSAD